MESSKTIITVEFLNVKADFEYSISLSEALSSTRFSLESSRGCDIGSRDYGQIAEFKSFSLSSHRLSFLLAGGTSNFLLKLVVVGDAPIIFGTLVLAPETLAMISNRSTRSNLWGTTPWILPVDFWESQMIERMLDADQSKSSSRGGNAKTILPRPTP